MNLIHLDKVIDYTPLDESLRRRGMQWPQVFRKDWAFGVEDGKLGPQTRPTRDRLGPSSHSRRRDDDRDGDRDGRHGASRCGERRGGDGGDFGDSSWSSTEHRHQRQERHDRRPSRSPDRRRRGDSSRHRSRSAGPVELRGLEVPLSVSVPQAQPGQTAALQKEVGRVSADRSRRRWSRSRTAEGSSAWGGTPSPSPGPLAWACLPSQRSLSPSKEDIAANAEFAAETCFPSPDNLAHFSASIPAPPSPLIPWDELRAGGRTPPAALGFEDCWSANIIQRTAMEQPSPQFPSPPHLRSPLHGAP